MRGERRRLNPYIYRAGDRCNCVCRDTDENQTNSADLNLATQAGAAELKKRVNETARAACRQLDEIYPFEAKNVRECTKIAIAKASPQVENAIAGVTKEAKAE
jgi:UrcA family protein